MNYKKLGYGVAIWAIIYLVATGFVAYNVMDSFGAKIVMIIIVAGLAVWAGTKIQEQSSAKVMRYTVSWVMIGLILDLILTVPFTGVSIFGDWSLWVNYGLIIVLPLFTYKKIDTTGI